jgi:hypothetical protein
MGRRWHAACCTCDLEDAVSNTKNEHTEPNEGEGSRSAARRYNEATQKYPRDRAAEAAKRAKEALEGDEAAELERANEEGKNKASDVEFDKEIPEKRSDVDEG